MSKIQSKTKRTATPSSKGGRPSYKRDTDRAFEVALFLGTGCKHEAVAYYFGISVNTLKRHYPNEVAMGRELNEIFWVGSLAAAAKKGSVDAIKFALSRKFGWTEKHTLTVNDGEDGIIFSCDKAPARDDDEVGLTNVSEWSDSTSKPN